MSIYINKTSILAVVQKRLKLIWILYSNTAFVRLNSIVGHDREMKILPFCFWVWGRYWAVVSMDTKNNENLRSKFEEFRLFKFGANFVYECKVTQLRYGTESLPTFKPVAARKIIAYPVKLLRYDILRSRHGTAHSYHDFSTAVRNLFCVR